MIPDFPTTRSETYLAAILGQDVELPVPQTRMELYLSRIAGQFCPVFPPQTRLEEYLAAWDDASAVYATAGPVDIATFTTLRAAPLKSLTVAIEPVQSGSGDPAPDNVRPISGWSEAKVWKTGKNLIGNIVDGEGYNANGIPETNANRFRTLPIKCVGQNVVTVSWKHTDVSTNAIRCIWDANGVLLNRTVPTATQDGDIRFYTTTLSSFQGAAYIAFAWYADNNKKAQDNTSDLQVEFASPYTEYEPYSGTTVTIDLDGTRYGGTLDVLTGVLTVDRAVITLNGTETWGSSYGNGQGFFTEVDAIERLDGYSELIVCDRLKTYANNGANAYTSAEAGITGYVKNTSYVGKNWIYAKDGTSTTSAQFKTWLASNNLQVVYPLATPQTVQLTPEEVTALLGSNNIWADAGDVTVEYRSN